MKLKQLTYTNHEVETSHEQPNTFVLMVDPEMHEKHKRDKSIPLAEVVASFQIHKFDHPGSKSGMMVTPSKREFKEAFGTTNADELVQFMLENGKHHGSM
jgi:ribosome maturation protein Sdo1